MIAKSKIQAPKDLCQIAVTIDIPGSLTTPFRNMKNVTMHVLPWCFYM
jgi:hypothetical protein